MRSTAAVQAAWLVGLYSPLGFRKYFSADGPWTSVARYEYRPNASTGPGLPLAGAVYAATGPTIGRELKAKIYSAAMRSFRPSSFRISSNSSSVVITRPKNISIVLREAWCIPSSNEALRTVRPPRRRRNAEVRSREYLTDAEIARLIAAAARNRYGHRDATMVLVAYRHGLRAAELVTLRWDAVDFAHGPCSR